MIDIHSDYDIENSRFQKCSDKKIVCGLREKPPKRVYNLNSPGKQPQNTSNLIFREKEISQATEGYLCDKKIEATI